MVIVYTFLGLIILRVMAIGVLFLLLLYVGPQCPACGGETIRIQSSGPGRLLPWLERRWCLGCGWRGFTRRRAEPAFAPGAPGALGARVSESMPSAR